MCIQDISDPGMPSISPILTVLIQKDEEPKAHQWGFLQGLGCALMKLDISHMELFLAKQQ